MDKPILIFIILLLLAKHFIASRFEVNLVRQLSNRNLSQNFVVSPFAIRQALVLLYLGKDTRRDYQLARALKITGRLNGKIISYFGKARFKAIKQDFTMANRIYLAPDYSTLEQLKKLSANIGVDVENMNFAENSKSEDEIKQWLNNLIDKSGLNLFANNDVSNITQMVAVQGISVSPLWKHRAISMSKMPFSIARPNRKPFVYKVQMMYTVAPFEYFNDEDVRGVMIPFSKTDIGMLVLLPRRQLSTQKVLQNLDKYLQIKLQKAEETHLLLPIFTVQETINLNDALQALGIKKIFTEDDDDSQATVAKFRQYAQLESKPNRVLMSADIGGDNDQRVVNVNKPFVFVIKDQNTIYMVGRMESIR
ncbi:accessory gland protein Acp76A [Drosophila rhopaloa]|uniref:Accessory gland protein Acp76A n=1 Tax=Drosophila rhopaloa TaxID=1041015 RepID=A0A6P4ERC1_DRORH|nr:accessory gland protein Acp76A [Drosophila rhopaloa]